MEYPAELQALIDDLDAASSGRRVATIRRSNKACAVIEYGEERIEISGRDADLLLETPNSVDQLFDVLGAPENSSISVIGLELEDEVIDALERRFGTVDEGDEL